MAYAITTDLAAYLAVDVTALPADASRLIDRASEMIDYFTMGRIDPTNNAHTTAALNATCAQVEFYISNGEMEVDPCLSIKQVGKVTLTYAGGSDHGDDLCPRARRALFTAGLLYAGVCTP
jgi:hypothetical protein